MAFSVSSRPLLPHDDFNRCVVKPEQKNVSIKTFFVFLNSCSKLPGFVTRLVKYYFRFNRTTIQMINGNNLQIVRRLADTRNLIILRLSSIRDRFFSKILHQNDKVNSFFLLYIYINLKSTNVKNKKTKTSSSVDY